jgi:hypothetical protein
VPDSDSDAYDADADADRDVVLYRYGREHELSRWR